MVQKYFNRFEIKYQIDLLKRDQLLGYIKPFMNLDPHVQNGYDYEIRSLYFDSLFRDSYYEKMDGIKFRRKLRIRYYPGFDNGGEEMVFVEIKRKINENVSKSRIIVPFSDSLEIIKRDNPIARAFYRDAADHDKKTLEEIWYLVRRYNLKPACVVSYRRQPLMGKLEKRFRVTFDTNMKSRKTNFDLHSGGGINFLPKGRVVMEIKFNNIIPRWAISIIQGNNCRHEKISKFTTGLKKTNVYCLH